MRDYVIFTDSTTDLPSQLADELELVVLPLTFTVGDDAYRNYLDERELPLSAFYQRLMAGEPVSTSQPTTGDYLDGFRAALEQGKDVIFLALSSGISATYAGSMLVRDQLAAEYPEAKIYCVDTLCASMGEGLLVWQAVQKKREGYSIDALYEWLETNKLLICHWFTVEDLMHLYHHGRCSGGAAFMGSLLQIKPVLHVDNEGKLIPMEKVRSSKKAHAALVEHMAAAVKNPEQHPVFISHANNLQGAQYVEKLIRERWAVKDVVISMIGPVIGSHTSQGAIALFFVGEPR